MSLVVGVWYISLIFVFLLYSLVIGDFDSFSGICDFVIFPLVFVILENPLVFGML